ncbi:ATP-dependent DNA helicase [Mesorhizobium sp. M7A.F.Ca.US.008.03.1.1]|uniref:ATP-dependent helicase n=1 Tax=Mesorhizobium sp. M7A.F.Ca.US.008.03.1.1 TaxID=2496742 RepID=UPI000FCBE60C|nr:ATP-dependent DNA helicase [Mesorhizobium sp. M7A.F.Ca.US.008.03.1.1]RUW61853.1 ATP-dependent helicase [Mesorhizobium sp. M7A.F.Ca.US.008.03.1.1]
MALTAAQDAAVAHAGANLQLIACAGSGKTEVVARHIARLLLPADKGGEGLLPRNVVAFTFTEKAAAELKHRIIERCREDQPELVGMADMYIGTIHGFCLDLLRTEVPEFLKYEVLNEVQQVLFVNRYAARSGLNATSLLNGTPLKRYVDTKLYIDALSILRESTVDWARLAGASIGQGLVEYEQLLREKGYFDYSSILKEAVEALRSIPALRERVRNRLRVVIVDEYQDVNPIQESLVQELHSLGSSIRVVGDDDQTIFQFRGSDVSNILNFAARYPVCETIRLEDNFRSTVGISDVARLVIEKNPDRLPKMMRSAEVQEYEAGDIVALQLGSPDEEAAYIADTCKALRGSLIKEGSGERPISWSDMAVLVRINRMADPIRQALRKAGIPFVSVGMSTLFDALEAEAARQLFYLMAGEADRDTVIAAWRSADLGIPEEAIAKAVDEAVATRERMAVEDNSVRFSVYNIQRQFIGFLERIGLREEIIPGGRGEVTFYNLAKFSQAISDFEAIYFHSRPVAKYESFAAFLRHQAEGAYGESSGQDERFVSPDAVQILTIHRAKGLQWPVVFVPQLVRNRFPASKRGGRTIWHLIPDRCIGSQNRFANAPEDERRLFYVAVTRSQKHLHLTTAPTPGSTLYVRPSDLWHNVLESRYVKRLRQTFDARERGEPRAKTSIANVNLTFSDMRYFFECPYQFKMRTLYGFNAPLAEALGYGKSLHDALAELHARAIAGETFNPSDADALVDRHLRLPYAYPALADTMRQSAKRTVASYITARHSEFDKLEHSEKAIEVALENGVTVAGRIDLVRRRDTNEVAIVDLKSTQRAQAEELTEAQLHIYALGYKELTGRNADFVETYELDTQTRRPRAVDEDLIADVIARVQDTAAALRANDFQPNPSQTKCSGCDFTRLCTASTAVNTNVAKG